MKELLLALALMPLAGPSTPEPLPERAVARLGSRRFYHGGPGITCAVLSPDGKRAASSGMLENYKPHTTAKEREEYGRAVVLWDTVTGERLREFRVPEWPVHSLSFSPGGRQLAAACGYCIAVLDVETGRVMRELRDKDRRPIWVHFSPDGKQLLVREWESVSIWGLDTGKCARRWGEAAVGPVEKREFVSRCVPSPDGRFIAWHIDKKFDYSKLKPGERPPSPAYSRPTTLIITEAATGKRLFRLSDVYGSLHTFAFSRDGRRYLLGGRLCETATGKTLLALGALDSYQNAFSPDGQRAVVTTGQSRAVLVDLKTGLRKHELLPGHSFLNSATLNHPQVFSADGKWLLLTADATLRLFDTTTGREKTLKGHCLPSWPRFSPDGKTLVTTDRESRWTWAAPGWTARGRRDRADWEARANNQALDDGGDGTLYIDEKKDGTHLHATATGRAVKHMEGAKRAHYGLLSADNRRVMLWIVWDDIRLHDAATGKMTGLIKRDNQTGYPAFSRDGRRVAWAAHDNSLRLYDGATGKLLNALRSYRRLPTDECNDAKVLFSPDGRLVAVTGLHGHGIGNDGPRTTFPTRVFDVETGRQVARFYANPEKKEKAAPPSCSAWSPDGRLLAFAEDESGLVRLIEAASGQVRATFDGHKHGVHGLAFSPDGRLLASGGKDNVVFLWDVIGPTSGGWAELASPDGKRSAAAVAAFSRMGKRGVALLRQRLRPVPATDSERLARLIACLVSDSFDTREESTRALAALGEQAGPAMHRMRLNDRRPGDAHPPGQTACQAGKGPARRGTAGAARHRGARTHRHP